MSDFNNGFNPADKRNLGVNFNPDSQGKKARPEESAEPQEPVSMEDPWAGRRLSQEEILNLLTAQGRQNMPADIGLNTKMSTFAQQISPERHAQVTKMLFGAYTDEFGKPPSKALLQDLVDNYLIGHVSIQTAQA